MGKKKERDNENCTNGFAEWGGYMAAKRAKLMEQYHNVTGKEVKKISDIFQGVSILVNGLTNPNCDELKLLMAAHGGLYHMYQVSSTSHIIASNLPNVKIKHLGTTPIVKPSWITDSIEFGKLLDYKRYLLYTNQSTTQPRIDFPVVEKPTTSSTSPNPISNEIQKANIIDNSNSENSKELKSISEPTGRVTKTASDPNFLEEFYNNSRLHLISTLGAEFKQLVGQLRDKSNGVFPGKDKLIATKKNSCSNFIPNSVIMHIDMDCFFVSVGLKKHPELRGKPVAVTHARNGQTSSNRPDQKANREQEFALYLGRLPEGAASRIDQIDAQASMSEVASCSYEARKCGVKNGMFMGTAVKLCPDLKTIPYDFQGYKEVSNLLYQTIASYTLDIEAVSCDEMYVDVTEILQKSGLTVESWATHIRNEIMQITGCPCSTGFGGNRLQARLATRKAKPAGQFYLQADDVEVYMSDIPLADLPGVGRATLVKLKNLGLSTCGDVQIASLKVLQAELGAKNGETLLEQAKGIDRKPLNFHHERKSVSAEVNYGIRFKQLDECYNFLQSLSKEVFTRLSDIGMRARCLTLKLMVRAAEAPVETAKFLGHGFCDNLSKSTTSNAPISDAATIFKESKAIYDKLGVNFADLRGVGIQLSKLEKNAPVSSVLSKFLQPKNPTQPKEVTIAKINKENELTLTNSSKIIPEITNIAKETKISAEKSSNTKSGKRGRPKGISNKTSRQSASKSSVGCNSLNVFLKKKGVASQSKETVPKIDIDLSVLNELPEELRKEIIRDYKLEDKLSGVVKKSEEVDNIVKDNSRSRKNVKISGGNSDKEKSKKSPFSSLSWNQIRPIVINWVQSESQPSNADTAMLAGHFKELAVDRKIETLKSVFNFLYRYFSDLNCDWHKAYFQIVNITQEGMVARYGGTLMVQRKFKCCRM